MTVVLENPELISLREYARRRSVSLQAVQRAIASNRISVVLDAEGKPKINPATADLEWEKNTKHQHRPHDLARDLQKEVCHERLGKSMTDPSVKPNLAVEEPMSYSESRTVREAYEARLVKLEYETKIGNLISAEEVKHKYYQILRTTRDAILNIPDRISSLIAAENDTSKVHLILTQELRLALEELSG